jgi:predicted NAD/FAD-binding protein
VKPGSGERLESRKIVPACHVDGSYALLADSLASEREILSRFEYQSDRALLHTGSLLMPRSRRVWSSWNCLALQGTDKTEGVSVTYWINRLQGLETEKNYFLSLNPLRAPRAGHLIAGITHHHRCSRQAL